MAERKQKLQVAQARVRAWSTALKFFKQHLNNLKQHNATAKPHASNPGLVLKTSIVQPLVVWTQDFAYYHGIMPRPTTELVGLLQEKGLLHPRFALHLLAVLSWAQALRWRLGSVPRWKSSRLGWLRSLPVSLSAPTAVRLCDLLVPVPMFVAPSGLTSTMASLRSKSSSLAFSPIRRPSPFMETVRLPSSVSFSSPAFKPWPQHQQEAGGAHLHPSGSGVGGEEPDGLEIRIWLGLGACLRPEEVQRFSVPRTVCVSIVATVEMFLLFFLFSL